MSKEDENIYDRIRREEREKQEAEAKRSKPGDLEKRLNMDGSNDELADRMERLR